MKIDFDVDIDMANRDELLKLLKYTSASIVKDGEFTKHNTGIYLQNIPFDPLKQISDIDHKQAEEEIEFQGEIKFQSVDEIVLDQLSKIESDSFDNHILMEVYNRL